MADLSALVIEWVNKAEEDWQAAQLLCSLDHQAATTCFHCQQCAEKLLKASLLALGGSIPKTHDLSLLSKLLSERDPSWTWSTDALEDLTTGAVATRYPGYSVDRTDAAEAMALAEALRLALLSRLDLTGDR